MISSFLTSLAALSSLLGHPPGPPGSQYIDWRNFKANGVNLGGWLVQESFIDVPWWNANSGGATDEWGLCKNLGSRCGPVLEQRYATWITCADIDKLATANINVLRIPTTYAAWIKLPGTQLYSGNQQKWLRDIAMYAINKYNMHIVIDIHSLPGGVNGQGIGEADGHYGWFQNQTALDYSFKAVDAIITFIQSTGRPCSFTLEPINEPVDNRLGVAVFGSPFALSDAGAAWLVKYTTGVLQRVSKVNAKIPVMLQDGFKGERYFSSFFDKSANLVFDIHSYYFAGRGASPANVTALECADAKDAAGDGKFPVFVGEWSIEAQYNNTFAARQKLFAAGLYAFSKKTSGSAYWTAKVAGPNDDKVDGQGTRSNYWSYENFIDLGFTKKQNLKVDAGFCS
ncbi:glycoside hydrolase family 5 protein [Aureobasidium subglaciale EXF-2481]|uniref:glucan 1,3-beta-glucosidase n=1 Tax=Aureobasidium subglaciale (strain EXF-2481) TaxID=1043005 RepID=A0A074ZC82_AURSE|nr:glycoside hydrolase family 5 protein [Aureobasidium subglaciale EXF-2481]KEQ96331.1 glycoside hydrolase family 5 protein [Aureobasidium subglaciale EXF-2481]